MCQKRNELIPQEGLDVPCGPPPEEYLYRCGVGGVELLMNEAIIEVGISKFQHEYHEGFRP
jgi:hypothetical protein